MKTEVYYLILISLGLFISFPLTAQESRIDSLENLLTKKISNTTKIEVFDELSTYFFEVDLDKSLYFSNKLLTLSTQVGDELSMIKAYHKLGATYLEKNYELPKIIETYNKGLQLAKKIGATDSEIDFLNYKGRAYHRTGYSEKALPLHQEALKKAHKIGDTLTIIGSLCDLGNIFGANTKTLALAKKHYWEAIAYSEKINHQEFVAANKSNLGRMYYNQGNLDSALIVTIDLLKYAKTTNNHPSIIISSIGIGMIYNKKMEHEKAILYFNQAYDLSIKIGNLELTSASILNLSSTSNFQKNYSKTIELVKEGLKLHEKGGNPIIKHGFYGNISAAYEALGNYDLALENYKIYHQLGDSLTNIDKTKKIEELNVKYQVQQKEAENALLKAEKASQATINKQRTIITIISVLSALFLGGLAFMQKRAKDYKNQQNELLELKVAERTAELLQTSQELAEVKNIQLLEAAKNRFFANISHEFRTPLTLIQGPLSTLIDREEISQKGKKMLERALQNTRNLQKFVNQILDLTKFDAGQLTLKETPEIFYVFLKRTVANFESYTQSKDIQLKLHYDLKVELKLEIDKEKVEQIINNYISNAVKFTPKGGSVFIKVKDLENKILIAVEDTGIGIPNTELTSVFERFYQVQQTENDAPLRQDYTGSTGIGLSLCKEYATLMNGKVWAESPAPSGNGSIFYFEFPKKEILRALNNEELESITEIRTEQKESYLMTANPKKANTPKNNTILIVEDNYDLRDFITTLLSDDYNVITAENGQVALDMLNTMNDLPSLIVSDVMMPMMDGFKLLETLKSNDKFRHVPVMMLTARAELQDKLKALRIGVDDYIHKPFDNKELIIRVENLITNFNNRLAFKDNELIETEMSSDVKDTIAEKGTKTISYNLSAKDLEWLQSLEEYVLESITDFNFNADDLAAKMLISRSKLFRMAKRILGMTVNEYIKEFRLQKARKLIENGQVESTKEAAYNVGYKNVDYFAQSYEKRFGKRPSEILYE